MLLGIPVQCPVQPVVTWLGLKNVQQLYNHFILSTASHLAVHHGVYIASTSVEQIAG